MMSMYLGSIIVWYIIIKATISVGKEDILRKIDKNGSKAKGILATACIPGFRVAIWLGLLWLMVAPKEKVQEVMKKGDKINDK